MHVPDCGCSTHANSIDGATVEFDGVNIRNFLAQKC